MASSNYYKLFVLALALVAIKPIPVSTQRVINLKFDVLNGHIEDLYDMMKVALLEAQPQPFRLGVEGHLVLAPQRQNKKSPSDPMIHLHLTGEYEDEATIFIAIDDISICGFANKSGDKFILQGHNNFFPDGEHVLSFGREYSDLIRGGVGRLHTVPLGRKSMLHGLHALSWHNPEVGDPDIVNKQAKLGVCRFAMMVSESLRLTPIHDSFASLFDLETFASHDDCELVQSWGEVSKELLKWKAFNSWDAGNKKLRKININDATTALQKVDVILRKF